MRRVGVLGEKRERRRAVLSRDLEQNQRIRDTMSRRSKCPVILNYGTPKFLPWLPSLSRPQLSFSGGDRLRLEAIAPATNRQMVHSRPRQIRFVKSRFKSNSARALTDYDLRDPRRHLRIPSGRTHYARDQLCIIFKVGRN